MSQPDVLFVMTDQQRFDTIAALGNPHIFTPNLDQLVRRGVTFRNAYSTCPVCVPARYTIRTGCEPPTTRAFVNVSEPAQGQRRTMTERCGPYLAQRMRQLGYRTFGIGKFHSSPWDEQLGYEVHLHSEELYESPEQRRRDAYAAWIADEYPHFSFIEGLMGERTEMYYIPQMSPTPAEAGVERWAAARAVEQIRADDARPYFGLVSFIGPHPPFAPPLPFNRMYDPDRMPNPIKGDLETDHLDEQIPWMNQCIWAEDINDPLARILKARYYGEISYIDDCLGRILDAVEARGRSQDTLICFFSDHGDHLGDHHAWQKESFFEASCRIPLLVSCPARLPRDRRSDELVCLTDLFGIATSAAGKPEFREGIDLLGTLAGDAPPREYLIGYYAEPGSPQFKVMVRDTRWKYIFMANGGRELLFDLENDPNELHNAIQTQPTKAAECRTKARSACDVPGARAGLGDGDLRVFPFHERQRNRICQFDASRGVAEFPRKPEEALQNFLAQHDRAGDP
ncbi:MAG TPA: sulfatase-like hydrolase/transferase [Candidatus Hydrogenedentes bacterium]|nr:sulfatase-like hydrolase/transferase [Candidatus Hydrogenedentota bacterium]